MFKLDLSKMKHVKSDDKSTVLRHPLGHEVTLFHNVLAPHNQEALKALAGASKEAQTPEESSEMRTQKMAQGGTAAYPTSRLDAGQGKVIARSQGPDPKPGHGKVVQKLAEGGTAQGPCLNPNCKSQGQPHPNCRCYGGMAEGGKVTTACAKGLDHQQGCEYFAGGGTASYPTSRPDGGFGKVIMKEDDQDPQLMADGGNLIQNVEGEIGAVAPIIAMAAAKGGKVQRFADGANPISDAPDDSQAPVDIDPAYTAQPATGIQRDATAPLQKNSTMAMSALNDAAAGKPQTPQLSEQEAQDAKAISAGIPIKDVVNNATGASKMQLSPQEQQSLTQSAVPIDQAIKGSTTPDYGQALNNAYSFGMQSASEGQQAASQMSTQRAAALKNTIDQEQAAQNVLQNTIHGINTENDNLVTDIKNGYIDPNKYWTGYTASNGDQVAGHSKIATGIGMILAGFNPTASPNAAIQMFQHQMDRSIDAQKSNLNANHNLLRANMEKYRNTIDATNATRLGLATMLGHQVDKAAADAGTLQAKSAADAFKSQLNQAMAPHFMELATRQSLNNISQLGQQGQVPPGTLQHALDKLDVMGTTNPAIAGIAKDYRARMSPNGDDPLAKQAIAPEDRDKFAGNQRTDAGVRNLMSYLDANGNIIKSFLPQFRDVGKQMAQDIQIGYRGGQFPGVYKEGEQALFDRAINGDPLAIKSLFTNKAKLREIARENNESYNNIRTEKYGLPAKPLTPLDAEHEKQLNVVNKKDGHTYQKVGNQFVRVK